jgi:Cu-Zn family superoxide dismutase
MKTSLGALAMVALFVAACASHGQGRVRVIFEVSGMSVEGGQLDVIGKSVVVHRDRDDYKSQPAGDSGPRIACGVIRRL